MALLGNEGWIGFPVSVLSFGFMTLILHLAIGSFGTHANQFQEGVSKASLTREVVEKSTLTPGGLEFSTKA